MNPSLPLIFDIARGSFEDGPGVRTTVFLKGCPLSCPWCHNPESQSYHAQTLFYPEACIDCKNCKNGKPCFTLARRTAGISYTPEDLIRILLEDKPFYDNSNGGVTFSGGEALGFPHYLSKVMPVLKDHHIHIAVQTCGYFDFETVSTLLPCIDLIYFDFKIMDADTHEAWLGKPNRLILDNFARLLRSDMDIVPRIPLIPGFVATRDNLDHLARFFSHHRIRHCEFLYYHPGGQEKRVRLNKSTCQSLPVTPPTEPENMAWIEYFKDRISSHSIKNQAH